MTDLHLTTTVCWCAQAAVDGHVNEDGSRPGPPDLDDTTNCPIGRSCTGCDTETGLTVVTAVTQVGILCVTICGLCAELGNLPGLACSAAAMQVLDHCGHLDIDLDEMAAAIAAEPVEADTGWPQ
ncbi:hypothetical protein VA596_41780 [Amycolatopsis sp., V23-08]|uniref:Uncharacterized protein n=1 Tax=Amycolatopsis heterodermiae TaxID=3110235 RepID=A0ABU5RIK2_9PSEU|nr:hypothetical protein [Amycolatopsis sp., V23-08]MEA5366118.1 hypothetical protein [Amycolatopsis sp., V23-08]